MDYEFEDGSFYNFDQPDVDYSSFLNTLPELTTPELGFFDSIGAGFDNLFSGFDGFNFDELFSSEPELLNDVVSNFDIEDTPFMPEVYDIQDTPMPNWEPIGDQPGDYDLTGGYGNPLAPGVKDATDAKLLWDSTLAADKGNYVELDKNGSPVIKNAEGKVIGTMSKDADGNVKVNSSMYGGTSAGGSSSSTTTVKDGPKTPTTSTSSKDNSAALLAALLGGLMGLLGKPKSASGPVGYKGAGSGTGITSASRQALSPSGAPGSGGKRFMSDVAYAAEGGLMSVMPGQPNESVLFMAGGGKAEADLAEFLKGGMDSSVGTVNKADYLMRRGLDPKSAFQGAEQSEDVYKYAAGGQSDLGSYTHAKGGRMLKGPGDGMSDDIPATIEGKRPARLANDEFVVPADVVSHLGNGSSDAGADVLYEMMADVRKARTGSTKQGKQINPKKHLPKV